MEIIGKENGSILDRDLVTLRDPLVLNYAKIAAVGVIAIGAVVFYIGKAAIDAMENCD